jgi:hypothetical protein
MSLRHAESDRSAGATGNEPVDSVVGVAVCVVWHPATAAVITATSEAEAKKRAVRSRIERILFAAMIAAGIAAMTRGAVVAGLASNRPLTLTSG